MANGPTQKLDKRLDFILRHGKPLIDTFNAHSAITRAEDFLEEVKDLEKQLGHSGSQHPSNFPPLQFLSYYQVGLVNCLEWHARSRLRDLLRYDASKYRADDFQKISSNVVLENLLQGKIKVAELVAASTLVNSFDSYKTIIFRVLTGLVRDKVGNSELLDSLGKVFDQVEDTLSPLFDRRHELVHEIRHTQVGHVNLRDRFIFSEIADLIRVTRDLMLEIELKVWEIAEPDLANLIPPRDQYSTRNQRLQSIITDIEDRVLKDVLESTEERIDKGAVGSAIQSARFQIECETRMLESMRYGGMRYFSLAEPLVTTLLEDRLSYLRSLEATLLEAGITGKQESEIRPEGL